MIQRSIVAAVIFLIQSFLSCQAAEADLVTLFIGKDLNGWEVIDGAPNSWSAFDGVLRSTGTGGWLSTTDQFHNFELNLEFRSMTKAANSGVFLRTPQFGKPSVEGLEVQLLDEDQDRYKDLQPYQYTGGLYYVTGPSSRISKQVGEWQEVNISCDNRKVRVAVNHITTVDVDLGDYKEQVPSHPGLLRSSGCIGLQSHGRVFEYRNIRLRKLPSEATQTGKNRQAICCDDKDDEAATAAMRDALLNSYGTLLPTCARRKARAICQGWSPNWMKCMLLRTTG